MLKVEIDITIPLRGRLAVLPVPDKLEQNAGSAALLAGGCARHGQVEERAQR